MLEWKAAADVAAEISGAWTREEGPGGAIALFDATGVRAAVGGGLAAIEQGTAFTPDTPGRWASISKHVCAALLLREGVPLEAELGTFLPELPPALAQVPLARALDMTGALPDLMEALWQQGTPFTASLDAERLFAAVLRLPALCGEPGEEMAYSNTGWRLAQRLLERRTGQTYAQLAAELFAPLDVAARFVSDESVVVEGLACGYWREGEAWRRGRYGLNFSASGGMAGSVVALARWLGALMAGQGELAGRLARLAAPRAFADGSPSCYRLGLVAPTLGDLEVIGHGGSLPGWRNHFLLVPAQGVGVAVLSNREEDTLGPALRVLAALTGRSPPAPAARAPAGLFAAEEGPFWGECSGGALSFMGAAESLVEDGTGGWRSLPAYLDMQLHQEAGGALVGRFGGVARRLLPVPATTPFDIRLAGHWRDGRLGVEIDIDADGTAHLPWPVGKIVSRLVPLPGGRAIADLPHGPWRHRSCFWLVQEGILRMASHRSRILAFHRMQ